MAIRELLKSTGLAAVAAGMVLALPLDALAKGNRDWSGGGGGGGGGGRHGGGGQQDGGRAMWRAQQQQIPAQGQPQVQVPQRQVQVPNVQYRQQQMPRQVDAPAQVQWRGNRDVGNRDVGGQNIRPRHQQRQWNGGDGGGNNGGQPRRMRQAQVDPQVQIDPPVQAAPDDGRRLTRNRSYVDPNRNRTYRASDRDNWRGGDRHDRDRTAWSGNRNRYDGDRHDWNRGDHQRWNNKWRHDNRYNWHGYRNRHGDRYRLGSYYSPYRGYYYNRLSVGFFLDSLFFSSRYWIADPWEYRLPPAYGPYRWVRYYDDVLLVDIYSGEVVDVIYDFFW